MPLAILLDAAPSDCGGAAALASVTEAIRAYEQCVVASRGRNECPDEFGELDGCPA
jgi:hypothetical protein